MNLPFGRVKWWFERDENHSVQKSSIRNAVGWTTKNIPEKASVSITPVANKTFVFFSPDQSEGRVGIFINSTLTVKFRKNTNQHLSNNQQNVWAQSRRSGHHVPKRIPHFRCALPRQRLDMVSRPWFQLSSRCCTPRRSLLLRHMLAQDCQKPGAQCKFNYISEGAKRAFRYDLITFGSISIHSWYPKGITWNCLELILSKGSEVWVEYDARLAERNSDRELRRAKNSDGMDTTNSNEIVLSSKI